MSDQDYDKIWLQNTLNAVGIARAAEAIQQTGAALPCRVVSVSGSLVTVVFEITTAPWILPQITIPKLESQWIRTPTQVGDFGLTIPADVYISAISGQGGNTPDMTRPGNLAALGWLPVGSTAFPAVNINAAYVSGPEGAVIQTEDGSTVITANANGVTIVACGKTWTFNESGFTMSTGKVAETHIHSQGNDSHGDAEQNTSEPLSP